MKLYVTIKWMENEFYEHTPKIHVFYEKAEAKKYLEKSRNPDYEERLEEVNLIGYVS